MSVRRLKLAPWGGAVESKLGGASIAAHSRKTIVVVCATGAGRTSVTFHNDAAVPQKVLLVAAPLVKVGDAKATASPVTFAGDDDRGGAGGNSELELGEKRKPRLEPAVEEVERIVGQIRSRWPRVQIILRADSGFAREELMAWCEAHGVDFCLRSGFGEAFPALPPHNLPPRYARDDVARRLSTRCTDSYGFW